MINCQNISKHFEEKVVFSNFSYQFADGLAYAIRGPNGSGKTTLLKTLSGLLRPDDGSVERIGQSAWFSFSSLGLMDRLSGRDYINNFIYSFGADRKALQPARSWYELEGFTAMLGTDLGHCSMGMRGLLGLYCSTTLNANNLFWDEPFSNLSPINKNLLVNNWPEMTKAKCLIVTDHGQNDENFIEVVL